ncbi:hypothetical protein ACIPQH_25325 [Streptomyces rubiginosohelvolus]|uniref:hypothetical protein n=1 Tax=Streptomyces rubiginosohelvolus TaxID=67362 RepID=UPI0038021F91
MKLVGQRSRWRDFAHRRGWIASPAAAFAGVPFGPQRRQLAVELLTARARQHDPATCPICLIPDEEWP